MPGVTIAGGYGAGGGVVAPAVAALLELPLLDRAISSIVAGQLHVSVAEAEEGAPKKNFGERFLSLLSPLAGGVLGAGTDAGPAEPAEVIDDATEFRTQADSIMRTALADGAVILGRGGAAAFVDEPGVLRVRMFGPAEARIARAAKAEGVDLDVARERLDQVDSARRHYVRRLYKVDIDDPSLYHLQFDGTALDLGIVAELIATAYRSFG